MVENMPLRDLVYGYPSSGGRIDFAAISKCRYLELLYYPNLPFPTRPSEGELDDTSLLEWFNKDLTVPSTSTGNNQAPSGGLRLLIGTCDFSLEELCPTLSFRRESFHSIEEHLGLPKEFLKSIPGNCTQAFKFSNQNRGNGPLTCFVFTLAFFRPQFYQLAVSYDKETRLTHSLLLTKGLNNIPFVSQFFSGLQHQQMHCELPLLLALMSTEQVIDICIERLDTSDRKLNELEAAMGQHEYDDRPKGNPLELDFLATTRALNHVGRVVGADVTRLKSTLIVLDKILDWGKEIIESQIKYRDGEKTETTEEITDGFRIASEKIDYLADSCRALILRGEYEEKRSQALTQVVFQYMTQKDIKVNTKLAESSALLAKASKEDSSSMKTIAILGMFFLPATFVAAIFAMPVFNWDGGGTPFVKEGFKYYLAIVIPLTFLVLAVWASAMLLPWRAWLPKFRSRSELPELGIGLTRINP